MKISRACETLCGAEHWNPRFVSMCISSFGNKSGLSNFHVSAGVLFFPQLGTGHEKM